ncbi:synaptic vesicle glycoprotein 2C-like isoform X2 [Sitophilus oryzae]|uniref:Synaptic vesicle glycoprotein 2C-like isoform X2 n=1 Tax=Sitophilus oryzae TaxID=7048 RepID=A0A6J2Y0U0_SITOR|nr:synaptic vesicle glycoprotein 2C-like isoform X2 [Sitophilus oryzae]
MIDLEDLDTALEKTGYGRFHYEILAVSALSIVSMGFQNGLSSYVFPAAQCDLNLTSYELGILNMAFMIGGIASCFLWGALADNFGRKNILILAHFIDATVTLVCSVLPGSFVLLVCRFLNGFIVGAPGSIIFTYVAEFQPPKYKTPMVCCCGVFFTLSWLLLPLMAYFILPIQGINFNIANTFIMVPWRFFLIILTLPEFLVTIWLLKTPETPKFHFAKGNHRECLEVLKTMYSRNTGNHPENYPVRKLATDMKMEIQNDVVCEGKSQRILRNMVKQIKSLFVSPLLKVTFLTCFIMFGNMFGMFGLGLWLPEIFVRFDQFEKLYPNATPSIKELSQLTNEKNISCESTFDSTVTFNTVVIGSTSLFINIICSLLATKLHFKIIPLTAMLVGGVSSGIFYFLTSSMQNLVVASIFQAGMIIANMTIGSIAVELYPTSVVGIGLSLIMFSGRLGAMTSSYLFGYFMDTRCEIPIFVVAFVVLLGGVVGFFVPRQSEYAKRRKISTASSGIEVAVLSHNGEIKFR